MFLLWLRSKAAMGKSVTKIRNAGRKPGKLDFFSQFYYKKQMKTKNAKLEWTPRILTLLILSMAIHFFLLERQENNFTKIIKIKVIGDEKEIIHEIKGLDRNDILLETAALSSPDEKRNFLLDIVSFFILFSISLGIFHIIYSAILRVLTGNFGNKDSSDSLSEKKSGRSIFHTKNRKQTRKVWVLAVLVLAIVMHFLLSENILFKNEPYTKMIKVKVYGNEEEIISVVKSLGRDDIAIYSRELYTSWRYPGTLVIIFRIFMVLSVSFGVYLALYTALLRFLPIPKDEVPSIPGLDRYQLTRARLKTIPQGIEISIPSREGLPSRGGGKFPRIGSCLWLIFWSFGGIVAISALFEAIMDKIKGQPNDTPIIFLSIWLLGWGVGEGWALYTLFKREKIIVSGARGEMTIGTSLFWFDIKKTHYDIFKIKNLRQDSHPKKTKENLLFDYENKTVRFCKGIDAEEAAILFRELSDILASS